MNKPLLAGVDLAAVVRQLLLAAPIRLWALILAGPALTLIDVGFALVLWLGRWPAGLAEKRLEALGGLAFVHAGLVLVVVVSLAAVKLEAETKLGKLSIGGEDRDDPPAPPAA